MSQVTVEIRGPVLIVSLDDPGTRNAMTADMAHEVASALDRLDESPELHVGVLYGLNGVFSSGMNLKAFRTTGRRPIHPERGGGGIVWSPPRKPMIAAVEGYAYGLGFEMVLACDLVVAAADARMALPEVKHGLVAAGGGALRLLPDSEGGRDGDAPDWRALPGAPPPRARPGESRCRAGSCPARGHDDGQLRGSAPHCRTPIHQTVGHRVPGLAGGRDVRPPGAPGC